MAFFCSWVRGWRREGAVEPLPPAAWVAVAEDEVRLEALGRDVLPALLVEPGFDDLGVAFEDFRFDFVAGVDVLSLVRAAGRGRFAGQGLAGEFVREREGNSVSDSACASSSSDSTSSREFGVGSWTGSALT